MLKLVLLAAGILLIILVTVHVMEARLVFFPTAGISTTPRDYGVPFESVSVATEDGERLQAWILRQSTPRATVVYLHGNGGNLSIWLPILLGVHRQGYEVYAIDYRGYGTSTGTPSERGLYRDVDAVIKWTGAVAAADLPVVYWGRSLGAAMAAYAATRRAADGLILESGFRDARSLMRALPPLALVGLFSSYRFPTVHFVNSVRCPVLVIHGDSDSVIPYAAGRELFEAIREPKQFMTIRGGDHNEATPPNEETYWETVNGFIAGLQSRQ